MANNLVPENIRKEDGHGSATDIPTYTQPCSDYLFSEYQASLADGAEITSPWLDMECVDKWQGEFGSGSPGLTQIIETSSGPSGTGFAVSTATPVATTFQLFNVIVRQRYLRIRWQNNTGSVVANCYSAIKASYGSSDKQSVIPLNVDPVDFSQSTVTQAQIYGINERTGNRSQVQLSGDNALFVANANRLSELKDRIHVQATATTTGAATPVELPVYTIPSSGTRDLWLTSLEITLTNTLSIGGLIQIKDGGVGGTVVRNYIVPASTNQTRAQLQLTVDYTEPVLFGTNVHVSIPAIGLGSNVAVNITGYTEDQ